MKTRTNFDTTPLDFLLFERCFIRYHQCRQDCISTRDRALRENEQRRTLIEFQRRLDLLDCRITNLGNEQAITQCQAEINDAAEAELAQIDAQEQVVRTRYAACIIACKRKARECMDELEDFVRESEGPVVIEVDCIEGHNAPCFKPVPEICTQIFGPCDDCLRTLCGDDAWSFESDIPLDVTLAVATDPKKDARVLATSIKDGNQAILLIPRPIRLRGMEQLYLGFSSSEKPAGPVKVLIYRI
jgi:hypothetical protein